MQGMFDFGTTHRADVSVALNAARGGRASDAREVMSAR